MGWELEWVHGKRAEMTRSGLVHLKSRHLRSSTTRSPTKTPLAPSTVTPDHVLLGFLVPYHQRP